MVSIYPVPISREATALHVRTASLQQPQTLNPKPSLCLKCQSDLCKPLVSDRNIVHVCVNYQCYGEIRPPMIIVSDGSDPFANTWGEIMKGQNV